MEYVKIGVLNKYKSCNVNPLNYLEQVFEMYSVPSFEFQYPEIVVGNSIGSSKQEVQEGDILLCKINPRINRVWIVGNYTDNLSIASSEWIVIRNKEHNAKYLAWYFRTKKFKSLMESQVTGIGGSLTRAQPKCVKEYLVPIHERKTQDKIVQTLDTAQSLIDKRKGQIQACDELIKSQFVEMFGDPVENSMGWELPLIEDVVSNEKNALKAGPFGSALKKEFYVEHGYKIYGQEQVISGDASYGNYYVSEEKYKELENCAVKANDVLISLVGTYGKLLIMPNEFEPGIINPRLMKITFDKQKVNTIYFQHYFQSEALKQCLAENTHGGTMNILNVGIVRKIKLPLPPLELQKQFATFVQQVDKLKVEVQKSLNETQMLFDSLMQKHFKQ